VAQLPYRGPVDRELIEMGYPCVELSAVCYIKGKVIKACQQWVKGIA